MQTEEVLPSARIQIPPIQSTQASEFTENKNTKYFKTTVRGLGVRNSYINSFQKIKHH